MSIPSRTVGEVIARRREANDIIVSTMSAMRWLYELSPSPLNLACVPLMGGAAGLGLGLALARPDRRVLVLDGDGSLLMQLGSLATVAGQEPSNFIHFVFDNGVWFEGGADLKIPAAGKIDFAAIALATGYHKAHRYSTLTSLETDMETLLQQPGPTLIHIDVDDSRSERGPWSRDNPQGEIPDSQLTRMGDEARTVMQALREHDADDVTHSKEI